MLLDRRDECKLLDQLMADVRAGESRALVVRGDAGIGKTALLEYLLEKAAGFQVVRAAGIQSEMELAFAALHQVCGPMLDRLVRLPYPQQEALRTAFGLALGPPPDRFLVGLAVLGLFAEVAQQRPLVCVVDDAQWLDRASAQVLAFVGRRLLAESVAMIFAVRESLAAQDQPEVPELAGLAELLIIGLPDGDARALLVTAYPGPVDERVLERVLTETRGNPLALLELPRGFTPRELAGGFGLTSQHTLPRRIEESFRRQVEPFPAETRQLLLVAAVEPAGDAVLVRRAAEQLGLRVETAAPPAQSAGLAEFGSRVRFRHPLVRSAIYRAAPPEERRRAHTALAQVTDPQADPDRRAWHHAQAAAAPDEDIAAELERSAGRAQARGGLAAAAAFLERASELTPEPIRRGQRALAAAQAKLEAGQPDASLRLLSLAQVGPLDELQRAEAELLRVQIAFTMNRGSDAPSLLLKAAAQLEQYDVRRARDTYLDALMAAWFAGHLASGGGLREVAEAARVAPAPSHPSAAADLLLDALAVRFTDGYAEGAPSLKHALRTFRDAGLAGHEGPNLLWYTHINVAADLWDDETLEALAARFLQLARDAGALALLPLALTARIAWHTFAGDLTAAAALLTEQETVVDATGIPVASYGTMLLAAWRGTDADAFQLIEASREENARRGEGAGVIAAGWVQALLCNSLGRYDEALTVAQQATDPPVEIGMPTWSSLVELVEAAARAGRLELADGAFQRLTRLTQGSGTDWALGLEARCRALLSKGDAAESCYREAIERLGRTRIRSELARARLLYGEWLRRENRRVDAREQLRTAHDMFTTMGAHAFAERAARDLAATGEAVHKRTVDTVSDLTAQEGQIARMVRDGLSNAEIAARLFISPRTVEWHLSKIFAKLHITSRRQLRR